MGFFVLRGAGTALERTAKPPLNATRQDCSGVKASGTSGPQQEMLGEGKPQLSAAAGDARAR
jgi:hypothetical protein